MNIQLKKTLTALILMLLTAGSLTAATITWKPVTTGYWETATNWEGDTAPTNGDDVIITAGAAILSSPSFQFGSVTVTNGILMFTNWTTCLNATNVFVYNAGTLTTPFCLTNRNVLSNRVWVVCTNMLIDNGGTIDVNYRGWGGGTNGISSPLGAGCGFGPGGGLQNGRGSGGGHGGWGGYGNYTGDPVIGGVTNDSVDAPVAMGSGGGAGASAGEVGGSGGGAVQITAAGVLTNNGTITANGRAYAGGTRSAGGSGGSIYITCDTIDGNGGVFRANGGAGYVSAANNCGGAGGGGRIALAYNPAAQSNIPLPSLQFSAAGGYSDSTGDVGTVWFPDKQFFESRQVISVSEFIGQLAGPFASWSPDSLTVSNTWIRFPQDGFALTVTNDLLVTGGGILDAGNGTYHATDNHMTYYNFQASRVVWNIGGNLLVTNGGTLNVYPVGTNASVADYGALVSVTGDVVIAPNSWIYLQSPPENGGPARFQMANLSIISGGGINSDFGGFLNDKGYGKGDLSTRPGGGAYGGAGGGGQNLNSYGGIPYGSASDPRHVGTGGCSWDTGDPTDCGGRGGGLIWLVVTNKVTVEGTLTAGGEYGTSSSAGGSGGGINIACKTIAGNGIIRANGGSSGTGYYAGGGGGGRIAINYDTSLQSAEPVPNLQISARGGSGLERGDLGTVYLPDSSFIQSPLTNISGQILNMTSWNVDNLIVSNVWVRFPTNGFQLTVTNDLTIAGASGRFEIGGDTMVTTTVYQGQQALNRTSTHYRIYSSGSARPTVTVGGNLQVGNSATLIIYSTATNATITDYGALVDVAGNITLGTSAWIFPWCNPTNGGGVLIKAQNVTVPASAGICADLGGFMSASGSGLGLGSGAPASRSCGGGGYGGNGASGKRALSTGGVAYGSSNAPINPGSGGSTYSNAALVSSANPTFGGWGGGSIRVQARDTITLDGSMTARGQGLGFSSSGNSGAGSGGGIYLVCRTLASSGTGILNVVGGHANPYSASTDGSGGGGGGRIAIWRAHGETNLMAWRMDGGTGYISAALSQTGTMVWGSAPDLATDPVITNVMAAIGATSNFPIQIWNPGVDTDDLFWSATASPAWLKLGTTNGVISVGQTNLIVATNDATSLAIGWYTGTVVFVATNWITGTYPLSPLVYTVTVVCAVYDGTMPVATISPIAGSGIESTNTLFTVFLDKPAAEAVMVDYAAIGGTAIGSGTDFTLTAATLTINPGMIQSNVYFAITDDIQDETNETIVAGLINSSGVTIGANSNFTYTIFDNDDATWVAPGGTSNWFDNVNWSGGFLPVEGNDVVLGTTGAAILLTNTPPTLSSFTLTAGTLIFSNWTTSLTATNVTISGGLVTMPPAYTNNLMSNRVWFVCRDFTLLAPGTINVDGRGYKGGIQNTIGNGFGTSGGDNHPAGPGYGGRGGDGGRSALKAGGATYGQPDGQALPGSGSGGGFNAASLGGNGGGAVQIDASGHVIISGTNTADGGSGGDGYASGGSGGGIYIGCRTFAGTNGVVKADGKNGGDSAAGGGGGRIAVVYNTNDQAALPVPGVRFSVTRGTTTGGSDMMSINYRLENYLPARLRGGSGDVYGQLGTLYFPDNRFLASPIIHNGLWITPTPVSEWRLDTLIVSNAYFRLVSPQVAVIVSNQMLLRSSARLELSNATVSVGGDLVITNSVLDLQAGSAVTGSDWVTSLSVTGALILRGSSTITSKLYVTAGATNGITDYGALVTVNGETMVGPYGAILPQSHIYNGGSPLFRLQNLTVYSPGGAFNADRTGYRGGFGPTNGIGPGWGLGEASRATGAGHGGRGGMSTTQSTRGATNDLAYWPMQPGSGGGGSRLTDVGLGGRGGGLIRIAAKEVILNGALTANGSEANNAAANYSGGGAGGGILLSCRTFAGEATGLLSAKGGAAGQTNCGGGGGGRIAVAYGETYGLDLSPERLLISTTAPTNYLGSTNVMPGSGFISNNAAEAGTVYFIKVSLPLGTIFTLR